MKAVVGNEDEGKKQKFCVEFAQCYYILQLLAFPAELRNLSFNFLSLCNDINASSSAKIRKQPTFHNT